MTAYHNSEWAECYDLWTKSLIGDGPVEDIAVFETTLKSITARKAPGSVVTLIDVGTGSGSVLIDLQTSLQNTEAVKFEVWGTEPSASMLERARRFWNEGVDNKRHTGIWKDDKVAIHWSQCGANDFAKDVYGTAFDGTDLITFAAGGISHMTDDRDIKEFLGEVSEVINPRGGRAIISFLYDYMPKADDFESSSSGTMICKPSPASMQRIKPVDHLGLVYNIYPPFESANQNERRGMKTRRFKLDVEDADGNVLRTHQLSWDVKVLDKLAMLKLIHETELELLEIIKGSSQEWWVLKKPARSNNEH